MANDVRQESHSKSMSSSSPRYHSRFITATITTFTIDSVGTTPIRNSRRVSLKVRRSLQVMSMDASLP